MSSTNVSTAAETAAESRHSVGTAFWLCVGAVAVSLAFRVLYLMEPWRIDMSEPPAFVAAEGLVGLMARHILRGARPIFYYGQYYLGAFEAYVAAVVFRGLGESMTTLRLVPTGFAVLWIVLTGLIARHLYGARAGYLAATLMALPSQFAFEWGFTAWGGHSNVVMILLTVYLLLLVMQRATTLRLVALGFVTGLSLWVNQLALGYLPVYVAAVAMWVPLRRKQWALLLVAAIIGVSPLIYGNIVEPLATVRNLAHRVQSSAQLSARLAQMDEEGRFYRAVPLFQVLGAQPRRDGLWSVPGTLVALFLTLGSLGAAWRSYTQRDRDPAAFSGSMVLLACAGMSVFVGIAGFFGQPVGRYNLALFPILCVLVAGGLARVGRWAIPIVAVIALGNAIRIATPIPVDGRTPISAVIDALVAHDLRQGYGADNMYDLVFESHERVIIQPVEWTRHEAYEAAVGSSERVFYLYRDDQQRKISYQVFMGYLASQGIQYRQFAVGEYHVLYDFQPSGLLSSAAIATMRDQIRGEKGTRPRKAGT